MWVGIDADFNSYISSISRMVLPAGENLKKLLESEKELKIPSEIGSDAREFDSKMELESDRQSSVTTSEF